MFKIEGPANQAQECQGWQRITFLPKKAERITEIYYVPANNKKRRRNVLKNKKLLQKT